MDVSNIKIPIYPEQDILDALKYFVNISSQFTLTDLRAPTPEKMRFVYSSLASYIWQQSPEQLTQIPLSIKEIISQQDCNVDVAAGNLLYMQVIAYMFQLCNVSDFRESDISSPVKKRTRRLLSSICNFLYFFESLTIRNEITEKINNIAELSAEKLNRREMLKEKIVQLRKKKVLNHELVQDMNIHEMKARQKESEAIKQECERVLSSIKQEVEEVQNYLVVSKSTKLLNQAKSNVEALKLRKKNLDVRKMQFRDFEDITPQLSTHIKQIDIETYRTLVLSLEENNYSKPVIMESINKVNSELEAVERFNKRMIDRGVQEDSRQKNINEQMESVRLEFEKKRGLLTPKLLESNKNISTIKAEMAQIAKEDMQDEAEHEVVMKVLEENQKSFNKKLKLYRERLNLKQIGGIEHDYMY